MKIHVFGENVVDLESKIDEGQLRGAALTPDYLSLPKGYALRIHQAATEASYVGKINLNDSRISSRDSVFKIPVDDKYSFEGALAPIDPGREEIWKRENGITDFVELTLLKRSGGGGGHNCATGVQVYLNDLRESGGMPAGPIEEVSLYVPFGSGFIKQKLPGNLNYHPVLEMNEAKTGVNVNVALDWGKKLTFRSIPTAVRPKDRETALNYHIKSGDAVLVDSVKDSVFLESVVEHLNGIPDVRFILAPTDSMLMVLGKDKVLSLASRSDLIVANESEINTLFGHEYPEMTGSKRPSDTRKFPSSRVFIDVLKSFTEMQHREQGKRARILVTHGERGATMIDSGGDAYYQPVAVRQRTDPMQPFGESIVNTNGCGDAFCAIALIGCLLGLPAQVVLHKANAAGHICAFEAEASGPWMATESRIEDFRRNFGMPNLRFWNYAVNEFRPVA